VNRKALTLLFFLVATAAHSEPVITYTWDVQMGGQRSIDVVHVGSTGMLTEQRDADGDVTGEFVVLPDRFIMNDFDSKRSMVMDPNNMPQIPGFGGAGPGGLGDVLSQAQGALRDAPPEARRALEGLLGGLQGAASRAAEPRAVDFRPTGTTGTTSGMDWEEYEVTIAGQTSVYRLADWDDVDGAEALVAQYRNMAEIFQKFMANTGMGAFLQQLEVMPTEIVDFMVERERFPIYMQEGRRTQQLVGTGADDIDTSRFGPRFELRSFGQ